MVFGPKSAKKNSHEQALHYTQRDRRINIEFRPLTKATAQAGSDGAINAVAGEFGLWERVRNETRLDPHKYKGKRFDPVVYVTALLFSVTSGVYSQAPSTGCVLFI
ncbi:MAG: hypothetical protein JRI36_09980 [Deltaproteobacteria bacterium]|nr:hypothetical protein [Deltaproteobacteria bacterium]